MPALVRGGDAQRPLSTAHSSAVGGGVARTSVERAVDAHVDASVLHDVLVRAGTQLESSGQTVDIGAPRILSSRVVTSADGTSIDREDKIELKLVITTKERMSLFVDALAGATVNDTTLTLTPRNTTVATTTPNGGGR